MIAYRLPRLEARHFIAVWLSAAALAAAVVIAMVERAAQGVLEAQAERTALQHAQTMGAAVSRLDPLLARRVATADAVEQLRSLRRVGDVFRFTLFDREGRLVLDSDDLDKPTIVARADRPGGDPAERSHVAEAVVQDGRSLVELQDGSDRTDRPPLYAEAHVPLVRGGHTLGAVAVYVDQTGRAAQIRRQFMSVGAVVAAALLALSGIGAWQWQRRAEAQRRVEDRVRYLAEHDVLSGALNRASFQEALAQAAWRHAAGGSGFAVLCIDLDHFKDINDTYGHAAGDAVLREVVRRLRGALRQGDEVARLGGDEFAILQAAVSRAKDVTSLARRVVDALSEPFEVGGSQRVQCGASVGAAIHGIDGGNADDLLNKADLAMYRAKASGRGTFSFYDSTLDVQMRERRALIADLRLAIPSGQLLLHYQPLFEADGVTLTGYEALLRWQHPLRGMVPPGEFIPLAEDCGLIDDIGTWVLQQACTQAAAWPAPLSVAVNLSAAQFRRNDLIDKVAHALYQADLDPTRLELEITESLLMSNTERAVGMLGAIGAMGVRIAMDDFGTGYSSLAYLWRFPFDKLKIDSAFTKGLSEDPKVGLIVRSVVSLAHTLQIRVTAEGVETAAQLRSLQKHGCDEVQGYLLGRPRPASQLDHAGAATAPPQRPPQMPNSDFAELPTVVAPL